MTKRQEQSRGYSTAHRAKYPKRAMLSRVKYRAKSLGILLKNDASELELAAVLMDARRLQEDVHAGV